MADVEESPSFGGVSGQTSCVRQISDDPTARRLDGSASAELRRLTLEAVAECLGKLEELLQSGFEFDTHFYPVRTTTEAGSYHPIQWKSGGSDVPLSYKSAVGLAKGHRTAIQYDEIEGIKNLLQFVKQHESLLTWLVPAQTEGQVRREHMLQFEVANLPLEITERHIHTVGWELDGSAASQIYDEMESWWIEKKLGVDLWMPIIGIDFDVVDKPLNAVTRLVRMDEKDQLARWPGHHLKPEEASSLAMATHALVVSGWQMPNDSAFQWMVPVAPPAQVPGAELFFESLGIVTPAPSGFIQVAIRPVGWAPGYVADLPPFLTGPLLADRRSARLQSAPEPLARLDVSDIERLVATHAAVANSKEMRLAATRLLTADRRSSHADRIVDLCVGLEALLSDSQGETTYKIAVRSAAMLALIGTRNPSKYLDPMKAVYAHRSAVVHGRGSTKNAQITMADGKIVPTEELARDVLRRLLEARVNDPSLTPREIDSRVLGSALDQFADMSTEPVRQD